MWLISQTWFGAHVPPKCETTLQQFQMKNEINPDEGEVNWSQAAVCRGDMVTDGSGCNTPVCLLSNVILLSTAAQVIAKMNQFSVWIRH